MPTQRVIVTGGTGKAGHWLIEHRVEHGYDVVKVDIPYAGVFTWRRPRRCAAETQHGRSHGSAFEPTLS